MTIAFPQEEARATTTAPKPQSPACMCGALRGICTCDTPRLPKPISQKKLEANRFTPKTKPDAPAVVKAIETELEKK